MATTEGIGARRGQRCWVLNKGRIVATRGRGAAEAVSRLGRGGNLHTRGARTGLLLLLLLLLHGRLHRLGLLEVLSIELGLSLRLKLCLYLHLGRVHVDLTSAGVIVDIAGVRSGWAHHTLKLGLLLVHVGETLLLHHGVLLLHKLSLSIEIEPLKLLGGSLQSLKLLL